MIFIQLALLPVLILSLTGIYLLINQNWRNSIVALSVQYLAVFWLVGLVWPLGLAAVKLVAGWMAGAVLSASRPADDLSSEKPLSGSALVFRIVAAGLVLALVISIYPTAVAYLPASPRVLEGGLALIGLGLLQLGMSARPLRQILGLLTALAGFDLVYSGLETSILMAGLEAAVTLGLALVGAYLLGASGSERKA